VQKFNECGNAKKYRSQVWFLPNIVHLKTITATATITTATTTTTTTTIMFFVGLLYCI